MLIIQFLKISLRHKAHGKSKMRNKARDGEKVQLGKKVAEEERSCE